MKNLPASNASWMSTSFDDLLAQNDRPVVDLYSPEDTIRGTPGDDTLIGTAGDDKLNGRAGADSMTGGTGNDSYIVDNAGDVVVELTGGGADWVYASVDYVLGAHVENLKLWGTDDLVAMGNSGVNTIIGNDGNNLLQGGGDSDDLYGGLGNDTLQAGEVGAQGVQLYGGAGDDSLEATGLFSLLQGGDGNDRLIFGPNGDGYGGSGNDYIHAYVANLYGGSGDDTLVGSGDRRYGNLDGGTGNDELHSMDDSGELRMYGGAGRDTLYGGNGSDTCIGGGGRDVLLGGGGIDYLQVGADQGETADGGASIDYLSADFSALSSDIVWINDPGTIQVINGNSITGIECLQLTLGSGNDVLVNTHSIRTRFFASDGINAGAGNDSITSQSADPVSHVSILGGAGNDTLTAGAGGDYLQGDNGADVLAGGGGEDLLRGGSGGDRFHLSSLIGTDEMDDFSSGEDTISIASATLPVGDGDLDVEGAVTISAPGGYSASAELVIATHTTLLSDKNQVALALGSATEAYAAGQTAVFVVDDGASSAVFYFKSAAADALISGSELTMLTLLTATDQTAIADYVFFA